MTTTFHKFTGKAKWAKVYDPEEFRGAINWKIDVYQDKAQLKLRKEAGIQSKIYEDEDGTYVTFKRPKTKLIKGILNEFHGPKIFDADDNSIVTYKKSEDGSQWERVGTPVLIGNGSLVEVEVAVYDAGAMGKGQRLESVKVIDLIHYEREEGSGNTIVRSEVPVGTSKGPWE